MAGRGNPSFLKNQKARKRADRASAKRAARQARSAEKRAAAIAAENPTPPAEELAVDGVPPSEPDTEQPA